MRAPDANRVGSTALIAALAAVLAIAAPLRAQDEDQTAPPAVPDSQEVRVTYERETFVYPVGIRRDPFEPLIGSNQLGPRIERLQLKGIIYDGGENSVALLTDETGQTYRLRRGDVVGNARVIEVGEREVRFAVDNLGVVQQHTLELRRRTESGGGES